MRHWFVLHIWALHRSDADAQAHQSKSRSVWFRPARMCWPGCVQAPRGLRAAMALVLASLVHSCSGMHLRCRPGLRSSATRGALVHTSAMRRFGRVACRYQLWISGDGMLTRGTVCRNIRRCPMKTSRRARPRTAHPSFIAQANPLSQRVPPGTLLLYPNPWYPARPHLRLVQAGQWFVPGHAGRDCGFHLRPVRG